MSTSMGTAAGGAVAPGAPQPTHIHVYIHQEPKWGLSLPPQPPQPSAPSSTSQTLSSRRLLVASWVVQIVLGLLSVALGGLGCVLFRNYWGIGNMYHVGIWTGVAALLAGVMVFIYEKRGGICWGLLRTLLALAAFGTAIAAIYFGGYYFQDIRYYFSDFCGSSNLTLGAPPSPPGLRKKSAGRALCPDYKYMLMTLSMGFQAVSISVWVLLLLASLAPLFLCCWRRLQHKAEKDPKALLGVGKIEPHLS